LIQTCLTQFVVHGFQRNITHCTVLTLLIITPSMMSITYRACSVWRQYDIRVCLH